MRYTKDHKAETRARIVRKASVRLREKGARGVGVAELMKDAGLTHGGFYAHFASREALLVEAVAHAMDRSIAHWRKSAAHAAPDQRFSAIVDAYLTSTHRDDPGHGCAIAALGAEVAREGPEARGVFSAKLEEMIGTLTEQISSASPQTARKEAIAALAVLTGSLILARAAGNEDFSEEILDIGRDAALRSESSGEQP